MDHFAHARRAIAVVGRAFLRLCVETGDSEVK